MDDLLSEKEQIEQIRSWWSEYGGYVIFGVAAGALLLFGINYYKSSKHAAQLEASVLYESLTNYVVDGNLGEAESVADQLGTDYADTTYAAQSKLALARLYMDKNRDQDAADVLGELLDLSAGEELQGVARLRLARVLLYQDKPQQVVDMLEGRDDPAFAASYGEALGDAYYALGRIADAEAAYQQVLVNPLSRGTVDQQLVQWKVLDLPSVAEEAPAAEPAGDDTVETTESDIVEEVAQ
ncbi:MAG: tetratricopeptide repeat protein [Gammaproteobacteria bacterium]|nr:tetratricopeptide repeat protein [Gammaproteobacteria bacterium]